MLFPRGTAGIPPREIGKKKRRVQVEDERKRKKKHTKKSSTDEIINVENRIVTEYRDFEEFSDGRRLERC